MALSFGAISLRSKNVKKLFHFLSFVFDLDNISERANGDIHFELCQVSFLISHSDSESISFSGFTLEVDSLEELKEYFQVLEFYGYKENMENVNCQYNDDLLCFSDPDGRRWEIIVNKRVLLSDNQMNLSNVRHC